MKAIKIRVDKAGLPILFSLLKANGFIISNPDQKKGNEFTIIRKGKQKIAGFDLFINENNFPTYELTYANYGKIKQWLKENGDTETTG